MCSLFCLNFGCVLFDLGGLFVNLFVCDLVVALACLFVFDC